MLLGWDTYSFELASPAQVEAVGRLRPRMVRWFCEIDRHVVTNSPTVFPWQARYGAAWQALADTGTPLVVQLAMKRPDWTGGDPGSLTGAGLWKAGARCGWLQDPRAKWVPFVSALEDALRPYHLDVYWGAWNEPDWRICWPWQDRTAPVTEWQSGQWLWIQTPPMAPFGWSGGHSRLAELRSLLPHLRWTSDGVGDHDPAGWLGRTAADPTISVIDVHTYMGGRLVDDLARVGRVVDAFDRARPDRLPIVVGEYGDDPNGTAYSTEWRDRALRFCAALDGTYPGRVLGVCAHLQGARQGTSYPPLWRTI